MRFYLLSDNVDTLVGMRLVGIDGVVLHEKKDLLDKLSTIVQEKEIAVILITTKLVELIPQVISELKLQRIQPLIVEIPDRHGESNISKSIDDYVSKAIGMKL